MVKISAAAFCVVLLAGNALTAQHAGLLRLLSKCSWVVTEKALSAPVCQCCRNVSSSVVHRILGETQPPCAVVQGALFPDNRSSPLLAYPMIAGKTRRTTHRLTTLRPVTTHP